MPCPAAVPRLLRVLESAVRAYDIDRVLEVLASVRAELGIAEQSDAPALGVVPAERKP